MTEESKEVERVVGYVKKSKKGVPTVVEIAGRRYQLAPQLVGPGKKGRIKDES